MSGRPRQQWAIVAGASGDVGDAVARRLAADGWGIVYLYFENASRAERALADLGDDRCVTHQADLRDPGDRRAALTRVGSAPINGLIVATGVLQREAPHGDTLTSQFAVNASLPLALCHEALGVNSRLSAICLVSSVYARLGDPAVAGYGLAKAALEAGVRVLAKQFAPRCRVNAVAPGVVRSRMTSAAGPDFAREIEATTPLRRLGHPEDVASAVSFLMNPSDAAFITGQVLDVDGGLALR